MMTLTEIMINKLPFLVDDASFSINVSPKGGRSSSIVSLRNENKEDDIQFIVYDNDDNIKNNESIGIIEKNLCEITSKANCKGFIIITTFSGKNYISLLEEYMKMLGASKDDYPYFYIVDAKIPLREFQIENLIKEGFQKYDSLNFKNNFVCIKTSADKFKAMSIDEEIEERKMDMKNTNAKTIDFNDFNLYQKFSGMFDNDLVKEIILKVKKYKNFSENEIVIKTNYKHKMTITYLDNNCIGVDTDYITVIKSSIYNASKYANCKGLCIITDYDITEKEVIRVLESLYKSMEMSFEDYPCFYTANKKNPDIDNLVKEGFLICNKMNLKNNIVIVKTSEEKFNNMNR